jgi:hypothetical protein
MEGECLGRAPPDPAATAATSNFGLKIDCCCCCCCANSGDPAGTVTLNLVIVLVLTALIEVDSSDVCNNLELLELPAMGGDVVVVVGALTVPVQPGGGDSLLLATWPL